MPGMFFEPVSRKSFLKTLGVAGAAALGASRFVLADDATDGDSSGTARIALLSDTHTPADASEEYRGFHPVANLRKIVPQVIDAAPQAAVINGDAARLEGFNEDYLALKALLEPVAQKTPVFIGLGNHDDRGNFWEVFEQPEQRAKDIEEKNVIVVETGPVRLLVLDSLLYVNKVAGLLGRSQRDWLAKYLDEASSKPTVLFVHHTLNDGDGDLLDVDRLYDIIEPHENVKAIFYGHSHTYQFTRRGRLHLINLPAVGYNFGDDQPVGWVDAVFSPTGVDLTLHAIGGNTAADGETTSVTWA
jgi:Icc protein